VEVPRQLADRFHIRPGSLVKGQALQRGPRLQLVRLDEVEGMAPDAAMHRTVFSELTVIDPTERLMLEHGPKEMVTRVLDLIAPIGLGQRGLINSPPKAGKTIMLQRIANAITTNRPDVILYVLLVDERPEEVTDMRRSIKGTVFASSNDRPTDEHLKVAEMTLERSKRLVEDGKDVVILLDSITRLARAYNREQESSGRTLSGGVDSRAMERPKRLFGGARNTEEAGSLTIIGTALVDTGSRMDEVIFEEFKGTGNMEVTLDRGLMEKRIFPAINIPQSGTRKEEKLFSSREYEKIRKLRQALFALKPIEAMERLLDMLGRFKSNDEFLDAV
jgi:transcription termination factor Rho